MYFCLPVVHRLTLHPGVFVRFFICLGELQQTRYLHHLKSRGHKTGSKLWEGCLHPFLYISSIKVNTMCLFTHITSLIWSVVSDHLTVNVIWPPQAPKKPKTDHNRIGAVRDVCCKDFQNVLGVLESNYVQVWSLILGTLFTQTHHNTNYFAAALMSTEMQKTK